jgi:hypothetical protein
MGKTLDGKPVTLADADISSARVNRRSVLGAMTVGLGATAAATVVGAGGGFAQAPTGCSDNDSGRNEDPEGYGVRCRPRSSRPTGCSDSDSGTDEDPEGYGVRCRPPTGRPTGCNDNDAGPNADQPGYGTRCGRGAPSARGCTDGDRGPNGDQPGSGTRCWI